MNITLPLPPSANRYWRTYKGRTVVSEEAKTYKVAAGWMARAAGVEPLRGPVAVTLRVFRGRKAGDLDNKIKVCLDSLNGIAWDDDSQVVELHAFMADDKQNPRVEVELRGA